VITEGNAPNLELTLSAKDETLGVVVTGQPQGTERKGSGGEHLSSAEVSNLPLNERDFSKLLLLAAGTMTDSNGAANFTQQFAVNGQRGVASVFAMDGGTTTDRSSAGRRCEFQRGCDSRGTVELRSDAGGAWAGARIHECGDEIRDRPVAWKRV